MNTYTGEGSFLRQECVIQLDFRERLRFSPDPSFAKQFLRFKAWADPFSSTKEKKKKEYRSLQLRKKYGNGFVRIQRVSLWLTWSCVRFSGWKYFRSCTIFLLFFSSSLFYVIFHGKLRIISARRTVIIRQTRDNRVTNHSVQSQFLEERFHFWKISSCHKQASAASSDANSSPNKNSTPFLPLEEIHRGITNVQYYLMRDTSNILA